MDRQDENYEEHEEELETEEPEEEEESPEEEPDQEETEESEPEEGEEEEEDEEPAPRKQRGSRQNANARIQALTRERYQTQAELERLRQEHEQLRQFAESSSHRANQIDKVALAQYESNAKLKLEQAKIKKHQAHENGDIQAQIDADVEMTTALNQLQEANSWKYRQEAEEQNRVAQEEQYRQHYAQQVAQNESNELVARENRVASMDWVSKNEWMMRDSPSFDAEMVSIAEDFADVMERQLAAAGRQDLVMSRWYYDKIDEHLNKFKTSEPNGMKKQLNMRPAKTGVSPARSGGSNQTFSGGRSGVKDNLNDLDKQLARAWGLDAEKLNKRKTREMASDARYGVIR